MATWTLRFFSAGWGTEMTPEQHEAVCDAHLMWGLQSASGYLSNAAVYVGMAREAPHWMEEAKRSIERAKKQIAEFEADLAANIADPEGAMEARRISRSQPAEAA